MPVSYHIHVGRELIVLCHIGTVTDEQLLASLQGVFEDPRFNPNFTKIFDLSQTDSEARTNDGILRGAELLKKVHEHSEPSKMAIIAPKDLSYGLSRVLEGMLFGSTIESKVFRTTEEARTWLDLSADELPAGETEH